MHKPFSKSSLRILTKIGMKIVNAFMLLSVLLSNITGVVQARSVQEPAAQSQNTSASTSVENTYQAPVFTHPESRRVDNNNSAAWTGLSSTNLISATPIGNWKFDEGSGTIAIDTGSGAHDGTINGTAAWGNGRYFDPSLQPPDTGLQFNGTDTYVGVFDAFDPTAFTIAMWVKPTALNRSVFVRTTPSGPTVNWSHNIIITSSGYFCVSIYDGAGKTVCSTTKVNTTTSMWYHVASTATNNGQLKLYVNGMQEGTPVNIGTLWTGGDRYYIGSNVYNMGYFSGLMDEVLLYSSALPSIDIQELYHPDQSVIDISMNPVTADDTAVADIQVTLKDGNGNLFANHTLSMNVSGSGNTITPVTAQTDVNGLASFTLKSTKAETKTISIFDQTQAIILESKPTITFIAGQVSPQKSTITTNLTGVTNDGIAKATITVTALDAFNNPIPGATVDVNTSGNAVVTQTNPVTDSLGKAAALITDTTSELVTISAMINNTQIQQTVNVRFHCRLNGDLVILAGDTCNFAAGTYTFNSMVVESSGTLILRGNPATNQGVTINTDSMTVNTGGVITADGQGYPAATGPGGTGSLPLGGGPAGAGHGGRGGGGNSVTVGGAIYGDLYNPTTLGSGGGSGSNDSVGGSGGGAIRLIVNNAMTLNGVIRANGSNGGAHWGAGAGGAGGSVLITASSLAGSGQILVNGGSGVNWNGISGGGAGGRIAIYTNALASTIQLFANGGWGYQSGGTGTIYLDGLDASLSTLTVSPSSVIADGTSLATVTVTLKNRAGIPVPNKAVEIALISGPGLSINNQDVDIDQYVAIGITNSSGVATAKLKTTTAGIRTIKAHSGQELIIQQGNAVFVAGPVNATTSLVTASPLSAPADGQTSITVTVTARDGYNNLIQGANVILQSTGNAVITQPANPTDNLGKASGQIVNASGEAVTVSATVNGVLLEDTVNLTFNSGDLAISMTAPLNGVANSSVNYAITVQQSNVMAAENVTLQLQLPNGVTYINQNSPVTPTQNGQTLTWNLGRFTPGRILSFDVSGYIPASTAIGEILNAQANVASSTPETTLANNSATRQTTIVDGHVFTAHISPTSHIVSIGASTIYEIIIQNTGLLQDQYDISVSGLNPQWYTLPQTSVNLLPGEIISLPLTVSTDACSAAGNDPFEVGVTSDANQQNETLPASVNFGSGPQVSGLVPMGGTKLGSRNVTINWQTDSPSTGVLQIFPSGHPENTQTFNSAEGTSHSIVVPNLQRNVTYEWYVDAISACGTTSLPHRNLTIGNGIVFVNRSQNVTIDRDYNQRVNVTVRNEDLVSHTLTTSMLNPYEDILVNFVDSGSTDQTITLQAGETRQVTLAIHTQDAQLHAYDLTASLTSDEESTPIFDNMTLHLTVLFEGDYTIVEDLAAFNELTLARTYVITNHGKAITDLSLTAVDPATGQPARIFLQPSLDHARLEMGQSIRVTAYPIFTAEDAAAQANAADSSQFASSSSVNDPVNVGLQTVPPPAVAPINFNLQASAAGVTKNHPGSVSCGGGKSIMPVQMQDCTMTFQTSDWYCTNRPVINTPIQVPSFIKPDNIASARLSIVYAPQSNVQPHNGQVTFNGTQIGSYSSQVPSGQYSFDIPASTWKTSLAGNAMQSVRMSTQHPNPGHYVSATGYKLEVAIDQATTFVCADSQTSAQQVVQQRYACSAGTIFNPLTGINGFSSMVSPSGNSSSNAGGQGPTESACDVSCQNQALGLGGDPINTKTGAFSISLSDLSFPTSAGELIFQRSYSSEATDIYTTALGYGWTFNHDAKLIFPTDPRGMDGFILFQGATGNQYLFKIEANGSFTAGPGVTASLTKSVSEYLITTSQQKSYRFNLNGRLLERADEQGQAFVFEYDAQGKLIKVSADSSTRFMSIGYDPQGRINSVSDHAGRGVSYTYNAAGDLASALDVLGQTWTYTYDSNHRMTQIKDPGGAQTLKTEYDLQGRAFKQYDGNGKLLVNIVYNANGTSVVYNALGRAETHEYDSRNTLTGMTDPMGADTSKTYDPNFRPATITDAGGDTTSLTWSPDGANLNRVLDAEGNETNITYDALNNPISLVDAGGFLTTFEYDGKLLTSSMDALNQETTYTYTPQGYLESVTLRGTQGGADQTTFYTYNPYGQRISMTDPQNHTWRYSYDSLGRLIDSTDPLERVTHSVYDAAGRLISQTLNYDPGKSHNQDNLWNITTEYEYDARGNQIAVTDTLDRTTRYIYDNAGRLITVRDPEGNISSNAYNAAGQLISTTDPLLRVTRYTYDAAGRLISTKDAMGNSTGTTYNADGTVASTTDALNRPTRYTYDSLKRVITVTQPNDGVTHNTYDDLGNLIMTTDALDNSTHYEYDALGRLIKTIYPPASPGQAASYTENFYNRAGQLWQTKDARRNATTYAYDTAGRQISVTDALGNVTRYEYDALGRRISITDALDNVTRYTYDELNRTVAIKDALDHTTSMSYDALGQTLTRTDPNQHSVSFGYDNLNRLISQTDPLNHSVSFTYDVVGNRLTSADANGHINTTGYDVLNRPVSFTDANEISATNGYDAVGNLITSTDGLGNSTVSIYNALNQPIVLRDALGNQTTQAYNARGELIAATDAEEVTTGYEYDTLGRLTAVLENYKPGFQPTAEVNVRTEYIYDENGNRLSITDGNGHATTFIYDELNRVRSESDPLGNTWRYGYDALGNRISMTDANGALTNYVYDKANRLSTMDYPGANDVSFIYDDGGRRTSMTDSTGTTRWTYNDANQVIAVTDPFNKTVSYSYDPSGNRAALIYPDHTQVDYAYDPGNRLTTVSTGQAAIAGYQYDAANRLTQISRANNVDTAYTYDDASRLLAITHSQGTELLSSFQYLYDKVGNRTQAIETMQSGFSAPTVTVTVTESNGAPMVGRTVYAFDGPIFTGHSKVTDANGQVSITLPAGSYRFRADVDGTQFWSGEANHCIVGQCGSVMMTVPQAVLVTVQDSDGMPSEGLKVYAFNDNTYTNFNGTTDANGQVSLRLPQGNYRFRADFNGTQFWSGTQNHCDVPQCTLVSMSVTLPVTVHVKDDLNAPMSGIKVYAFAGSTYTNFSATTNTSGEATFTLPEGNYRFRADYNGTEFWSDPSSGSGQNSCSVPVCHEDSITVSLPLTVNVKNTDGAPQAGVKVYAYDGTTYTNYNGTTDANGKATFTLPHGSYRFRADFNGTQFWSGDQNHCDVPGCTSTDVTVTNGVLVTVQDTDGAAQSGIHVYVFNGTTYTNYTAITDANGQATFTLPLGSYRFRADYNSVQYWSGSINHCELPGCTTLTVIVGPQSTATPTNTPTATATHTPSPTPTNTPEPTETGTPTPTPDSTPEGGTETPDTPTPTPTPTEEQASLGSNTIALVNFKVRSRIQSAPAQQSSGVTVSVQDTDGAAQSGIKVYAFDDAAYKNYSGTTDTNGQVALDLPDGSYRFRADLNGTQFWSADTNTCIVPACASATVTVTKPLTVTVQDTAGTAKSDIKVYAFDGTTYTNYNGTTDASGQVTLTLPQGNYRFRADLNGTQFWSAEANNCTLPGCTSASVTVTLPVTVSVQSQTGEPYPNLPVYVFDGTTYTGFNGTTDASGQVTFTLPQGDYRFRADYDGVQFWSAQANDCTLPGCVSATVTLPGGTGETTTTIDYTYDPLYRLTEADYSTGDFYHYAYDSVGNRLTQESMAHGLSSMVNYNYDIANRLTSAGNLTYTWDANGNLLNDGVNAYEYDTANRLTSVLGPSSSSQYTYNGLGDRLSQNGVNYTLDLNAGLTQVLSDGTTSYTYGLNRITQQNESTAEYFLGDALGSVRQLVNTAGEITLTNSYDPYGEELSSAGSGSSAFAYTGEQLDASGLTYLRARYYNPVDGRFMSRDTWGGDSNRPMSMNRWGYVEGNPINISDPTGLTPLQLGYVEGFSTSSGLGKGDIDGNEIVYDYATMTRARFSYTGSVGGVIATLLGFTAYVGGVTGFHYEDKPTMPFIGLDSNYDLPHSKLIIDDYSKDFDGFYVGGSVGPVSAGVGYFQSPDGNIKGGFDYLSTALKSLLPFEIAGFHTFYTVDPGSLPGYNNSGVEYYYDTKTGLVDRARLISDLLSGDHSPIPGGALSSLTAWVGGTRNSQISTALIAARRFEKYYYQPEYGQCREGQPDPRLVPTLPYPPFEFPVP